MGSGRIVSRAPVDSKIGSRGTRRGMHGARGQREETQPDGFSRISRQRLRRTSPMTYRRPLFLAAITLAATAPARLVAQAGGVTTSQPAAGRRTNFMAIDDLTLQLGADFEAQRRRVDTERRGWLGHAAYKQLNESTRFQETLGLTSSGSFFDDRVVRYNAAARWGLSQETYREDRPGIDLDKHPHGQILEYDLSLQALPAGKVSVSAFASQLDDRLPRPFLPSLDRRRERYGGQVTYNDAKLPMALTFEHLYDTLSSGNPFLSDKEERGEDALRYEATWQPTDTHSLRFNYDYQDRSDRYSGTRSTFDTVRNALSLLDTIQFGADRRSRLETLARWEDERGDWARDAVEIAPRLHLQHDEALATNYGFQYLRESFLQLESQTVRGDVGLTHQFRDLLTSTFNLYALEQNANRNYDSTEWGGTANFFHSRENKLGRFSANLSYTHSKTDTNDGGRSGVVVGESATFIDPLPVYLAHSDVVLTTIVVTDPQRFIIYIPGIDYVAIPLGRYMLLKRLLTGRIVDRQTVSVSYQFRTYDDFALRRDRVDYRIQQDFKGGWTPYYAGSLQDEDLDRRKFLVWDDRNINRHRLGLTYRQPRWTVGGEYEYNDDSVDPYQAMHLNGDVILAQTAAHQLSGRGNLSTFDFEGLQTLRPRDTVLLDLGMNYRYTLGRNLEAGASAAYRFQDDSLFGTTHGVDVRGSVSYRIGLFTVLVEVEYESLRLPGSDDESVGLWVKLRREIPIIGRTRS